MRINSTLRTAAAAATLALALAGCSQAEDAASKAADKAGEAAASATDKASDAAKDAAGGSGEKSGSGESGSKAGSKEGSKGGAQAGSKGGAQAGSASGSSDGSGSGSGVEADLGDFADDPDAKAAVAFYEARSLAVEGDDSQLKKAAGGELLEAASKRAQKMKSGAVTVSVVDVKDGMVHVCAGPHGKTPRVLTIEGGVATANKKGDHTC